MKLPNSAAILTVLLLGLAACGGGGSDDDMDPGNGGGAGGGNGGGNGGGGGMVDPPPAGQTSLTNTTNDALAVRVLQSNNSGDLVNVVAGTFDGTSDQVSVEGLQLAIDDASPLTAERDFSAALEAGTNFRIVYVPTSFEEIPVSGQSTYNGTAEVLITLTNAGDSTGTYAGFMDTVIVADFDTPNGSSITLDNISDATFAAASDPTAGSSAYTATGEEILSFEGVQGTQTGLASGSATTAELRGLGDEATLANAGASEIDLEAGFAGTDAFEIAGGGQIDSDDAVVRFGFTGEQ